MKRLALLVVLVGCAEVPEDGVAPGVGGLEPAAEVPADPSQIFTPLPAWQGWSYCGPAVLRWGFVAAVEWWRAQGRDLGAEVPCGEPAAIQVIDASTQYGPNVGEWAHVHYRGDGGADLRVFSGALGAGIRLESLFRHELGHVIGLQHSSDNRCLMWGDGMVPGATLCPHEVGLLASAAR
jgi:hypothetical protein